MGIGALIGASVGAALGDVGEGTVFGVAVTFFAILPWKLYASPAEFYLLTRFGPRAAKLYLAIAVSRVYLFPLTAGLGSAYIEEQDPGCPIRAGGDVACHLHLDPVGVAMGEPYQVRTGVVV